jgi:hypothetical protein
MLQDNNIVVRRAGLGQGWETHEATGKTTPPVRIRTGTHIVAGRLIGDTKQPLAFVWTDEAANDLQREVVICPDLEGSWLWENGSESSLAAAFPGNIEAQRLARKFDYWLKFLRKHWDPAKPQRFFWSRFHDEGVGLARKLQAVLVNEAVVRYWRPAQDPRSISEREIRL